jgi:DNA-binding protein Fis
MSKLQRIMNMVKCSLTITVNEHRDRYQTLEKYLSDLDSLDDNNNLYDLSKELYHEIIKEDNLIEIIAYKDTPVGSYSVAHHDMEKALDLMLKILEGK